MNIPSDYVTQINSTSTKIVTTVNLFRMQINNIVSMNSKTNNLNDQFFLDGKKKLEIKNKSSELKDQITQFYSQIEDFMSCLMNETKKQQELNEEQLKYLCHEGRMNEFVDLVNEKKKLYDSQKNSSSIDIIERNPIEIVDLEEEKEEMIEKDKENEIEHLKQQCENQTNEINNLKKKVDSQREEMNKMKINVMKLENEKKKVNEEKEELQKQLSTLQTSVNEMKQQEVKQIEQIENVSKEQELKKEENNEQTEMEKERIKLFKQHFKDEETLKLFETVLEKQIKEHVYEIDCENKSIPLETTQEFKEKILNKSNICILITTENVQMGCYIHSPITSRSGSLDDENAFVFSLNSKFKAIIKPVRKSNAFTFWNDNDERLFTVGFDLKRKEGDIVCYGNRNNSCEVTCRKMMFNYSQGCLKLIENNVFKKVSKIQIFQMKD